MHRQQLFGLLLSHCAGFVQLFPLAGAALASQTAAGEIRQNLAHQVGGHSEEMAAALERGSALVNQSDVGFVDQGGGLQGMIAALAAHVGGRQSAKFGIDDGGQGVQGRAVSQTLVA